MFTPTPIQLEAFPPLLSDADMLQEISDKAHYEKKLKKWQGRLLAAQQAYYRQGRRAMLVFEGWDASGKGGAIRRITEKLDPRGFQVYPVSAPSADELAHHYLYRFQSKQPSAGSLSILDRSYYGRVLVERIEEFASKQEWQRAYQEINEYERQLSDDGVRVIKLFMHISPDEQLRRFEERLRNPVKRWKLTEEDIRNRHRWADYEHAINDMFAHTSTLQAPWHLIPANHKWYARVKVLKTVVNALEEGVDVNPPPLDLDMVKAAETKLGIIL
jgi:PPK2 family polyphosphate:nucleotide phosphotransferase